jgi:hypothetical protein
MAHLSQGGGWRVEGEGGVKVRKPFTLDGDRTATTLTRQLITNVYVYRSN